MACTIQHDISEIIYLVWNTSSFLILCITVFYKTTSTFWQPHLKKNLTFELISIFHLFISMNHTKAKVCQQADNDNSKLSKFDKPNSNRHILKNFQIYYQIAIQWLIMNPLVNFVLSYLILCDPINLFSAINYNAFSFLNSPGARFQRWSFCYKVLSLEEMCSYWRHGFTPF